MAAVIVWAAPPQNPQLCPGVLLPCAAQCSHYNSNVHRGVHYLSAKATTAYEEARAKVGRFINASSDREVVFTRNASEAINLVAQTWGMTHLKAGDEVRTGQGRKGQGTA